MKRQVFISALGFLLAYDSLAGPPVEVEESGIDNWDTRFLPPLTWCGMIANT